jgi:hypothetical protein
MMGDQDDERNLTMSAVQQRLNDTLSRADEVLRERTRHEIDRLEREQAEQRRADAEQARADSWRNRELGAMFDDSFKAFGVMVPEPIDGERPGAYRRRLYERLRRRLPESHELAGIRADSLPSGQAYLNFEQMIIAAARQEGEKPSEASLPDDGMFSRVRSDDMGQKSIEWLGKTSFIKSLSRPGQRVARIVHRPTMSVLFGAPFSRAG